MSDIGRRCLLTSLIGFCFGIGTISASFQDWGSLCSLKDWLIISAIGSANRSAFSLRSHAGIPSGPVALDGFRNDSFLKTDNAAT